METMKHLKAVAAGLELEVEDVPREDRDNGFRCAIVKGHRSGSTRIGTMCRSLTEARQMLEAFAHRRDSRWT